MYLKICRFFWWKCIVVEWLAPHFKWCASWILLLNQHAQFDALEVRLKRREPAILDLQPITPANTPAPATVNNSSSLSFHNLDWDGDNYDPQSLDPSVPSRPLQVLLHLIFLIRIHILQSCF